MRVLFLTLYPAAAASARYRVHQFLPALTEAGLECTVVSAVSDTFWGAWHGGAYKGGHAWRYHLHELLRRRGQLRALDGFDRIVVQKSLTSAPVRGLTGALTAHRERLVYDIDDAVHRFPPDRLPRALRAFEGKVTQGSTLMGLARVTLAGNRWLEAETWNAGGHPLHFPTVVDTGHFSPTPQPDAVYRLGWMGSPSTARHLDLIAPCLSSLRDTEVFVIGSGGRRLPFASEQKAWVQEQELGDLARFSVGLMPLPRDVWTQGKCGLKALLCMAMGRPVIATPFGAANEIIEHGVSGLLADTEADWRAAIEQLRDPAERQRMGEAARARAEEVYSLKVWAPRMLRLLRDWT